MPDWTLRRNACCAAVLACLVSGVPEAAADEGDCPTFLSPFDPVHAESPSAGWRIYNVTVPSDPAWAVIELSAGAASLGAFGLAAWLLDWPEPQYLGAMSLNVDEGLAVGAAGHGASTTAPRPACAFGQVGEHLGTGEHQILVVLATKAGTFDWGELRVATDGSLDVAVAASGASSFLATGEDFGGDPAATFHSTGMAAELVVGGEAQVHTDSRLFGLFTARPMLTAPVVVAAEGIVVGEVPAVAALGYAGPSLSASGKDQFIFSGAPGGDHLLTVDRSSGAVLAFGADVPFDGPGRVEPSAPTLAAEMDEDAEGDVAAASVLGDARGGGLGASAAGDATGTVAVAGAGDAEGSALAVSATGHAGGPTGVGGCDAAASLCS